MSAGDRDDFLSRWSRRKLASRAGPGRPTADAVPAKAGIQSPAPPEAQSPNAPAGTQSSPQASETALKPPAPLPSVQSLTPESDFTPFMRSEVDPGLRRQALRTLFRDPRFNVMDGLDVYIDDYSKPDPIPEEWMGKLYQMARLGDHHRPEDESEPEGGVEEAKGEEIPPPSQGISEGEPTPLSDTSAAGSTTPESGQS